MRPDFFSKNRKYIERNLVNRLWSLKMSFKKFSVICGISLLHSFFFLKNFTIIPFNLQNHSVRRVEGAFPFHPQRGDGDAGIGPRQGCHGTAGSPLDQGTGPVHSQLSWQRSLGSHRQRRERLARDPAPPAVPLPSSYYCPHPAVSASRSQGNVKVHDEVVLKALWHRSDLGLNPQAFF